VAVVPVLVVLMCMFMLVCHIKVSSGINQRRIAQRA